MGASAQPGFSFPFSLTEALGPVLGHLDDATMLLLDSMLVERDQAIEDALTYRVTAPPSSGGGPSSSGATAGSAVVSETTYGQVPAVGVSPNYAHEDHTHGTPAGAGAGGDPSIARLFAVMGG